MMPVPRPLVLAVDATFAAVAANTPLTDSPDKEAAVIRNTPDAVTRHRVICDLPNWCGIAVNVKVREDVVPVLAFVPASSISERTVVSDKPVNPFDGFINAMVKEIVPLVKAEFEKNV